MKISRNVSRFFVVVAAGFFLLTVGPAHLMAGSEPGQGCGEEGLKYDPAPYMGDITVAWVGGDGSGLGNVFLSGTVEQAGKSDCYGFFDGDQVFVEKILYEEFINWSPNNLRTYCFENWDESEPFSCNSDGALFELVGVGAMRWSTQGDSFTAKFVIMHLEYK